ncbi:MAG TPA: shikimate kinase [Bacteroidales bacterium]|jgi:shikimate kinase|nr:AAA family ATPase [Bacteroidales bacterium]HNR41942.1 shikimate kinase [Bacteroidales bacterium]HQG77069.1 shikimate kinase [Bacteroidales bacterium]
MHLFKRIFLIGFMGSGKSTLGRKLAVSLGWTFVDMDEKIVEKAGMKIPEIFSVLGEPWFREMETKVLRSLAKSENLVVSTGGGAPCHSGNMKFMLETGLTIYLKLNPSQLASRLVNSKTERPLIKNIDETELPDYISGKLHEREEWYSLAAITIDGFDADIPSLISLVRQWKPDNF